ncbi:MAG: hypothetical protein NVSMB31_18130 [Vulcanimicrobiaceae bacterium]
MTTAKKKIAPPKPAPNRPWSQLDKHEQNAEYSRALHAYSQGKGENPRSRPDYYKKRAADETKGKA